MIASFKIGNIPIGLNSKPVLIAEIGINHSGNLNEAKKLVKSAADVGVKLIKHQTHIIEDEMSLAAKKVKPGNSNKSIYEIMQSCALNFSDEKELKLYTESLGLEFLSTPFSRSAVDRLVDLNVNAFKVGSGECNNHPLIDYIANKGKPIILSTGMNNIEAVKESVAIIERHKVPYSLLHTTNLYPTPHELVRLGAITDLQHHFPDIPIGLSDHTTTNHSVYGALALGSSVIEKHYTDDYSRQGPDISCSMDPQKCKKILEAIDIFYLQRGGTKNRIEEEEVTRKFAFSTVVSIKHLKKGDILTKDNIWVKRPGSGGIAAQDYQKIIGKKVKNDVAYDQHLAWSDIEKS